MTKQEFLEQIQDAPDDADLTFQMYGARVDIKKVNYNQFSNIIEMQ